MIEKALRDLEAGGKPIKVGMIGAGSTGRAIALYLAANLPGIRLVAIANRTTEHAKKAFADAGVTNWNNVKTSAGAEKAINNNNRVVTDNFEAITQCKLIDVVVEVTGTVEYAAQTAVDAINNRKHVVLVNAELDSLIGPILKSKADQTGVVLTNTDGDEPGVAMNLIRYLRSLGLRVVAAGNIKGMVDHYRTPQTQLEFAKKYNQDPRKVTSFADATKLSMETTILANATGFNVGKRGMYGFSCKHVKEIGSLLPGEQMLKTGLVDYALGAEPHTGAFAVIYENATLKKAQLSYYKMGDGPFYVFYTPYHLPPIQIASTIASAAILHEATVAPIGAPICEVITIAKTKLKQGDTLDGIGGFSTYGLIDNSSEARKANLLPISLSEGCVLRRPIEKDEPISLSDVDQPSGRLCERLWLEQKAKSLNNGQQKTD